ncbi:hypothetical protein [Gimesia algae]|uniref:Uncharacterized protein n=1 Tax=Gimesia algae TaxID=2527971 RepID=A0A517VMC2_9PLAN|nr:hypothetical protein [Gimesia algae]QDT94162.1 hypothetical protein Pan161_58550 [Gimesia algae]
MASFTDTKERVWTIEITLGVARKVKRDTEVDLLAALKNPESANNLMVSLVDDPERLGQVLYATATPPEDGLSVDDLFLTLDHEAAESAFNALDEAITDFFPPQVRGRLKRAKQKVLTVMQKETEMNLQELDAAIDGEEFEKLILDSIRGESSTALPVS